MDSTGIGERIPMMEQLDAEMLIGDPSSNPVSMSVRTALHSLKART